jgi:hypothetical protein
MNVLVCHPCPRFLEDKLRQGSRLVLGFMAQISKYQKQAWIPAFAGMTPIQFSIKKCSNTAVIPVKTGIQACVAS